MNDSSTPYPSASSIRRTLVTLVLVIVTVVAGFLFGIGGLYSISYFGGLMVIILWALVMAVLVRYGKLTNPEFTLPLSWGLGALMIVTGAYSCWEWTDSDTRSSFDEWYEEVAPDASKEQAWRRFMAESLDDPGASGNILDLFRYKAMVGEWHTSDHPRQRFVRNGFWAWWCWLVQVVLLLIGGTLGVFSGSMAAFDSRQGVKTVAPGPAAVKTAKKTPRTAPAYTVINRLSPLNILRALGREYLQFVLPIIVTVFATSLAPDPGRGIFIVFFISGFWVSAAMGALEPENDPGFELRRLGWHFINLLAMLALAVAALFVVGPISMLVLGLGARDLTFGLLFGATYVFFLLRLWPVYATRYLFRGHQPQSIPEQDAWGEQVVVAWRLTRTPGAFLRATLWVLLSCLVIISIYDWVYLALDTDRLRTLWSIVGLVVLLPLAHLIIVDRARAMRDANNLQRLLENALPRPSGVDEDSYLAPDWDPVKDQPIMSAEGLARQYLPERPSESRPARDNSNANSRALEDEYAVDDASHSDLHRAAATEHPEQARFLLARGAAPDARDSAGITPIQIAALHGRVDTVEILIEAGADRAQLDPAGRGLLSIARIRDHQALVQWLQAHGLKD